MIWPFKKSNFEYETIFITPFGSLSYYDPMPKNIKEIKDKISKKLAEYQDKMVAFHHVNTPFMHPLKLQEISANWNVKNNDISVIGNGDRFFSWKGNLDQFLQPSNNIFNEIIKIEKC